MMVVRRGGWSVMRQPPFFTNGAFVFSLGSVPAGVRLVALDFAWSSKALQVIEFGFVLSPSDAETVENANAGTPILPTNRGGGPRFDAGLIVEWQLANTKHAVVHCPLGLWIGEDPMYVLALLETKNTEASNVSLLAGVEWEVLERQPSVVSPLADSELVQSS